MTHEPVNHNRPDPRKETLWKKECNAASYAISTAYAYGPSVLEQGGNLGMAPETRRRHTG
jgi:hypothetical protein